MQVTTQNSGLNSLVRQNILEKANQAFSGGEKAEDFSKKINLTKDNAKNFFNKTVKKPNSRNKFFDGYIGFLSYELQCRLIGIKIPKQKFLWYPLLIIAG